MVNLACWFLMATLIAQVPPPNASETVSKQLRAESEGILAKEVAAIGVLRARLDKSGMSDATKELDALVDRDRPSKNGATRFRPLPEIIPAVPASKEPWRKDLKPILERSADAYEDLAQRALKSDPPRLALADFCLRATVARSPGRTAAYRQLGYLPHEGGWATPFALAQLKEGLVLHPTFGWVDKSWVVHLDKGELPAPFVPGRPTRWLPTADADALRREWGKGWQIKTEHFNITTNVPLSEAISFGNRLEALQDLFCSIMADLCGPELPLAQLAKNPKLAPSAPKKKHKVYYFAEKAEYVRQLLPIQGEAVSTSLGTYIPPRLARPRGNSASYFFRDTDGQLEITATLYHEASHQLLFETAGLDKYEDSRPNFWVFEGLGTYFETLTELPDGSVEVGGLIGPRIEQARIRLLKNREFVPIERFVRYNKASFNGDAGDGDIYLHYAQAMALTVFLMQANHEAYREGFLDHVRDVYKGRGSKNLEDRLGVGYSVLNKELLAYLKGEPMNPE